MLQEIHLEKITLRSLASMLLFTCVSPLLADSTAATPATSQPPPLLELKLGPERGNMVPRGSQFELFAEAGIENRGDSPRKITAAFLVIRDAEGKLLRSTAVAGNAARGPFLVLNRDEPLLDPTPLLKPQGRAVFFLPPLLLGQSPPPSELRLSLVSIPASGGPPEVLEGILPLRLADSPEAPVEFPVKGTWVALNGPSDWSPHRRAVNGLREGPLISQRFALDLIQFHEPSLVESGDFLPFLPTGDPTRPESYLCYGQEVLASGPGEVIARKDGLPDQPLGVGDAANLAGNHVVVKHGDQLFGCYAHLAPGSVSVKVGDRVTRGQLLGKVGNSGNTTQPHLHLHFTRGPEVLRDQAVPVGFAGIRIRGRDRGDQLQPQLPRDGEIVEAE